MICSRTPSEKFPRPSNEPGLRPRKSRMRGSAIEMSRSRNSYIRAPRSVTFAPIGMPSRILTCATDLRALAGDRGELLHSGVELLGVVLRLADAHVERDLLAARHLHDRLDLEVV